VGATEEEEVVEEEEEEEEEEENIYQTVFPSGFLTKILHPVLISHFSHA
jgi:hypothetical protein